MKALNIMIRHTLLPVLIILFFVGALTLFPNAGICADQKLKSDSAAKKKKPSKEELERQYIQAIISRINKLNSKTPPDYSGMAKNYMHLFERYPDYLQGKMAVWEAYEIYLKTREYISATATLTRIMSVYGYSETMENPVASDMPIAMKATARFELARLYAVQGDVLTAKSIARSVPNQFPGANVGRFSGEDTYYGAVEVICALEAARFAVQSKNYNQAIILLFDLIRNHKGQKIGRIDRQLDLEAEAVIIADKAIVAMQASEGKKVSIYDDFANAVTSDLADSRILFYKSRLFIKTYITLASVQRIEDAFVVLKAIVDKYPNVTEIYPQGDMPVAVAAIRELRVLFIVHAKDPVRALGVFADIEAEQSKIDTPQAKIIGAYARYYSALVNFQNMHNYQQTIYELEILLEKYPGILEYPSPRDKTVKPLLADHVRTVLKKAHDKNI